MATAGQFYCPPPGRSHWPLTADSHAAASAHRSNRSADSHAAASAHRLDLLSVGLSFLTRRRRPTDPTGLPILTRRRRPTGSTYSASAYRSSRGGVGPPIQPVCRFSRGGVGPPARPTQRRPIVPHAAASAHRSNRSADSHAAASAHRSPPIPTRAPSVRRSRRASAGPPIHADPHRRPAAASARGSTGHRPDDPRGSRQHRPARSLTYCSGQPANPHDVGTQTATADRNPTALANQYPIYAAADLDPNTTRDDTRAGSVHRTAAVRVPGAWGLRRSRAAGAGRVGACS